MKKKLLMGLLFLLVLSGCRSKIIVYQLVEENSELLGTYKYSQHVYDDEGRLISVKRDRTLYTYTYDSKGNLIEEKEEYGDTYEITTYLLNSDGTPRMKTISSNGFRDGLIYEYEYVYEDGLLVKKVSRIPNDSYVFTETFEYNDKKQVIRRYEITKNIYRIDCIYDEIGNLVKEIVFDVQDFETWENTFTYEKVIL